MLHEISINKIEYNGNKYRITHIVIGGERVQLPTEWQNIANDMELCLYDRLLLAIHFDGLDSLYQELMRKDKALSTEWIKTKAKKYPSKYRIYKGKLEYRRHSGTKLQPYIKGRAWNDKHINTYLCISKDYVHRYMAQAVRGVKKLPKELRVHHRLLDETATLKGNSLPYLTVMTEKEHDRLHYLLKEIAQYIKGNYMQQMEIQV